MAIKVLNDAVQSGRKIYGMTVNNLKDLFTAMDIEETGNIDFVTFETVIGQYHLGLSNGQLQALAQEFDQDGDGTIDYEEILNVFENTIAWTKLHSGSNLNKLVKKSKGISSSKVQSKEKKDKEWREERRQSLILAQSENHDLSNQIINEEEEALENNLCPAHLSTLVGYYNSIENACRCLLFSFFFFLLLELKPKTYISTHKSTLATFFSVRSFSLFIDFLQVVPMMLY